MSSLGIEVNNISKSFAGKMAVNNLSLSIEAGQIFGFLGPNGSGKTTAIRMLCGLLTPDKGTGTCLGYDIIQESEQIKKQTGYMPQSFSLYKELTIYENLDFMARMYSLTNRKEIVEEAIESLGLTSRKAQLTEGLSGGWKQRLALAACLLHRPQLLLLDEPTAGVDPKARFEFWEKIQTLTAQGVTVLVSTHYLDEAVRCHRLGYIAYGNLIVTGSPEELIDKYHKKNLEEVFVLLMQNVKDDF